MISFWVPIASLEKKQEELLKEEVVQDNAISM